MSKIYSVAIIGCGSRGQNAYGKYMFECKDMFEIVYEDQNVIIVNKGSGIETCDGAYNVADELIKQNRQVFAVHRIDRNTLGLVIFAKSDTTLLGNAIIQSPP